MKVVIKHYDGREWWSMHHGCTPVQAAKQAAIVHFGEPSAMYFHGFPEIVVPGREHKAEIIRNWLPYMERHMDVTVTVTDYNKGE